jgi:hypothetical protein
MREFTVTFDELQDFFYNWSWYLRSDVVLMVLLELSDLCRKY